MSYANDGDHDPTSDNDPDDRNLPKGDDDHDNIEDHIAAGNDLYHDADDVTYLTYGSPASSAEARSVERVVKSYYALGAKASGTRACTMMASNIEGSVAEDLGKAYGPLFLHGSKTCGTVMTRLFRHFRSRFDHPFAISSVRVNRNEAYAFLGSHAMPASYVILKREAKAWKINSLLGGPLP